MENQQVSYQSYKQHPIYLSIEIDCHGNVRNFNNKQPRYTYVGKSGYRVVQVRHQGKIKTLKVHRLVAELFLPSPSQELLLKCLKEHHNKVLVKHKDNNKLNNHFSNLEYSDLEGNTKQAFDDRLIPFLKGELNGRAVLTEDIVHKVCKAFEEGMQPKEASEVYGISRQQASKIRAGVAWKHISSQYNIVVKRRGKNFNDQS
jgi:hypothetical protein